MEADNLYIPKSVSHPGITLDEKLKETGLSTKEFAGLISQAEETVNAIIKGNSPITQELAVAFEDVTKIPANFWINRQHNYDECIASSK